MIIEDREIELTWRHNNKSYYVNKGYQFTAYGEKFKIKQKDVNMNSKQLIKVRCDYCGRPYDMTAERYKNLCLNGKIKKAACTECQGQKLSESLALKTDKYIDRFLSVCEENGYTPISTYGDYKNSKSRLKYICPIHGLQERTLQYIETNGCYGCKIDRWKNNVAQSAINEFYRLCYERGYKPISTIDDIKNEESWFYFECPKHGEQKIRLRDFKRGHGCNRCRYDYVSETLRLPIDDVIKRIESKNNNKLLNPEEYTRAIDNNLHIQCGSCGEKFYVSLNNYDKMYDGKCPDCSEKSVCETIIHDLLNKYGIEHVRQKTFPDCKHIKVLPFDFYFPEHNWCLEFDGIYHYEPIHGQDNLELVQKRDKIKTEYCKANGIKLIRIPYWEVKNIENIITREFEIGQYKKIIYPIKKAV